MMLKVNNEFINLPDEPEVVRQTKTADILDSDGDFSYEFMIPDTSENRRILGCLSYDTFDIDSELVSDNGHRLYNGITSIERFPGEVIACSFTSGNTNWFGLIAGKLVSDIPIPFLERFKLPLIAISPSPILVAAWANTEGIVFPFADNGRLRDLSTDRLQSPDFIAWTFLRDVLVALFNSNGLKIQGELLNDGLFNTLIGGNGQVLLEEDTTLPYYNGFYSLIGKNSQTLNTTPQKVTFTLDTYPYFNGLFNPWDSSTSRYSNGMIDIDMDVYVDWTFSASVNYTIEIRKNGVVTSTTTNTAPALSISQKLNGVNFDVGDYVEIWAYISSGTVTINSGATVKFLPIRLSHYYPQFLFGDMTQSDFVKSIFTMFNVIPTYDKDTKTVTANLFENLAHKEAFDLSPYVSSFEINAVDILADLAKDIILTHDQPDTELTELYNKSMTIPFGAAKITPERLLTDEKEITTSFTFGQDYFNERFRASLMDLNVINLDVSDSFVDIASVADDGFGIALFTTTESHGLKQRDYVYISDTSNNEYIGIGFVNSVPSDTTFKVQYLEFVSTATGKVSEATRSFNFDKVFIASYFANLPVSSFSFNSTVNYEGTDYSNIAWAFFLKQNYGLPIDDLRKSPAFGKDSTNFSITLIDSYYDLYRRSIMKPITVKAKMLIPEKVYVNLDLSSPFTINTPEFSWRFFLRKSTGYVASHLECEFELLKLS